MPLIINRTASIFDPDGIHRGDLVRAKHAGWLDAKNGIVTAVTTDKVTVLMIPAIGNVTNYFVITSVDAAAGSWEVRWTSDLSAINTHGVSEDGDA